MAACLRFLLFLAAFTMALEGSAPAFDARSLLASSAKMGGSAGWSDRQARITIETFDHEAKKEDQRVETKESLGEDLKVATLTEFFAPDNIRGLRVLDLWSADSKGESWVWSTKTSYLETIPRDSVYPSYRDAQLLDLLPRMSELVDVAIADEREKVDPGSDAPAEGDAAEAAGASDEKEAGATDEKEVETPANEEVDMTAETVVLDVDVGDRSWPLGRHFRVWIDTHDGRIRKIETRSPKGKVSRIVKALKYDDAGGRPTATKVSIENPLTKIRAVFVRSAVEYDRGLPPETFRLPRPSPGT